MTQFFTDGPPVWDFEEIVVVAEGAPVALTTDKIWLAGVNAANEHATDVSAFTMTDGNDIKAIPGEEIPPSDAMDPREYNLMPMAGGIKLGKVGGTLKVKLWGTRGV